jgi:DNA-binding CsgD family transcriptional regulator/tetratricopeptide (TPR) repeat protein
MSRRLVSPTLIGRASELATVARALDSAKIGAPVHQLVAGEAGVGKSRLVGEAATLAAARGMRVLVGGCADIGDGGVPYGPIVEALRSLHRDLDDEQLAMVVGSSRGDLARLVPSLSEMGSTDATTGTESLQPRLFDAVLGVLQRLSEIAPVLFVIEDLHWADPATRETVAFLIRQLRTDRVVLIMTFRADELHRRHPLLPWLAELGRSGRVERLDLERLDPEQTGELLAAILGSPPTGDLAEQIHRRSDGNPFFVEELLGAGEDAAAGPLPSTLREVLLARIVAMPERAQVVIGVAAVAGRRVDHGVLAKVAGMDDGDLLDALRTAVNSQVLVAGSAADGSESDYAFRHALLQEAAYDDLLPGERQRLHRAFAETLAELGPGTGAIAAGHWAELAYHWSAARDDRRAFEASIRAGEAAAGTFAFADARRHDERALELWSTIDGAAELGGIDRCALLGRAAVAAWLSGDSRRAVALRREAVAALDADADPLRVGTMLEQLGRALWVNGETEAALEAHEAAVAVMPTDPPTSERARVLSGYGQILMLVDRFSESTALCRQAAAMAHEVGARKVEGHALNTLGLDLAIGGRCGESMEALDEAIRIAREVADADDIGRGYVNLAESRFYCGDKRGAADAVREGILAAEEVGIDRTYGGFLRANGINYAYELGEWDEADRLAEESKLVQSPGRPQWRYYLTRWVQLLVAQGNEQAGARLEELRALIEGHPVETQFNMPFRIAAAEAALWRGDPDGALDSVIRGGREVEDRQWPRYHARLIRVGMRAAAEAAEVARARRDRAAERAAIRSGDELRASFERAIADARSRQNRLDNEETEAELATFEAEARRLSREPSATAWLAAAERWRARENPYLVGYCRWREAEALLGDGDRAAAIDALGEASGIARRLGAGPLRTSVEGLATRARLDLSTDEAGAPGVAAEAPDDPFGLTRRERDVLPLLVKGRTNRQIAEELFISENTAGVHVSNILGKMGASSRTEAAGIAARLGLGADAMS